MTDTIIQIMMTVESLKTSSKSIQLSPFEREHEGFEVLIRFLLQSLLFSLLSSQIN